MPRTGSGRDPTVVAIPFYFATMGAEYALARRRRAVDAPSAGNYERRDTVASLTMGVASLLAPLVAPRVLRPIIPGRGRYGRALVIGAVAAAAATTAADVIGRRRSRRSGGDPGEPSVAARVAARVSAAGGVASVVLGGLAVATTWQSRTSVDRLWRRRLVGSLGEGAGPLLLAIAGWDFIYYWNHRLMHECRYMWAIHVVHHSSEHYNLSTALRQPVLDAVGTPVPYGLLCLLGVTPAQVETARGLNLLYQYWIHTEAIARLGPAESVMNTPSHHRVHHGSNSLYIDRNHGSILILWDRLFGTFQPEKETVVYGLTKNIGTFNPLRIATHEFAAILRDVAGSTSWRERLSYVVLGPGWADRHRAEVLSRTR
jgi:sterol desaturase/sphingolipid hydroxylase (fatty acid hydroxylase superfamily)